MQNYQVFKLLFRSINRAVVFQLLYTTPTLTSLCVEKFWLAFRHFIKHSSYCAHRALRVCALIHSILEKFIPCMKRPFWSRGQWKWNGAIDRQLFLDTLFVFYYQTQNKSTSVGIYTQGKFQTDFCSVFFYCATSFVIALNHPLWRGYTEDTIYIWILRCAGLHEVHRRICIHRVELKPNCLFFFSQYDIFFIKIWF